MITIALLLTPLYPGALASPYANGNSYEFRHTVVPESAAEYNRTVDQAAEYEYSQLSPTGKTFVDRTVAAPDNSYTPTVCREFLLICDAYTKSELPPEFTYGINLYTSEASYVISKNDSQFLFQTGNVGHRTLAFPTRLISLGFSVFPLALLVGGTALTGSSSERLTRSIGAGMAALGLSISTPYIQMISPIGASTIGYLMVVAVWAGLIAVAGKSIKDRM